MPSHEEARTLARSSSVRLGCPALSCDRLDRGETTHSLAVWAASGHLSVYWLPLVHERWHPCAEIGLDGREKCQLLRSSTQTRESGRKTIIRQEVVSTAVLDPVQPCPASQLGCEVIWLGRATAGEILGEPPRCLGSLEGRAGAGGRKCRIFVFA